MMSGTSLDGVDVALIETDGERIAALGPTAYRAYTDDERSVLRQALTDAVGLTNRNARPGNLAHAESLVTDAHAEAVQAFLAANSISASEIAIVGFHGQTVLHRPRQQLTVQIGQGAALARRAGIPVAYDFRAADVAAGGEGAPLVPVYHSALVGMLGGPRPVCVLNIGGVANLTYCDPPHPPIACDTGPGNALIDDFLRERTGQRYDDGGALAAQGKVHGDFIAAALRDPFFDARPPKSLDRNAFADILSTLPKMSTADGAATLAMLTATTIARAVPHLPRPPARWIISGGGAHNRTLMSFLGEKLAPAQVKTADEVGWSGDAIEAQAFAYLAVRTLRGLPSTFPTTTGVPMPMRGGIVTQPAAQ